MQLLKATFKKRPSICNDEAEDRILDYMNQNALALAVAKVGNGHLRKMGSRSGNFISNAVPAGWFRIVQ